MSSIKASIVIPAFNVDRFICKTIDSVLDQAGADVEVIVVDDGSTDGTLECIRSYGDRVRWVSQANSGGPSGARNKGIEMSRGEFIFFFDSDDIMLPEKISDAVNFLEKNPSLGLVFTNFRSIDAEGRVLTERFLSDNPLIKNLDSKNRDFHILPRERAQIELIGGNFIGTPGVAMPRTVLDEVGVFNANYYCGEDWDLWLRVTERYDIAYLPKISFEYRRHSSSITASNSPRIFTSQIALLQDHLKKSVSEKFRQCAINRMGVCYFSLAYKYLKMGRFRDSRMMLKEIVSGVPRHKIYLAWIKTFFPFGFASRSCDEIGV